LAADLTWTRGCHSVRPQSELALAVDSGAKWHRLCGQARHGIVRTFHKGIACA